MASPTRKEPLPPSSPSKATPKPFRPSALRQRLCTHCYSDRGTTQEYLTMTGPRLLCAACARTNSLRPR